MEWTRDNIKDTLVIDYDDSVIFELSDGRQLKYIVKKSYLTAFKDSFPETEIFHILNVHPWAFCAGCVGYEPYTKYCDYIWPEIKDEDYVGLTAIVRTIYNLLPVINVKPIKILKLDTINIFNSNGI